MASAIVDENKKRDELISAADRGVVNEIILALNTLGEEKMISYDKEIEWLIKLKEL